MGVTLLIYELKGLVDSLNDMTDINGEVPGCLVENVKNKTDEIINMMKNDVANEPYREINIKKVGG